MSGARPGLPAGTAVAVTGGTGFIGGRLVDRLIELGARPTLLVRAAPATVRAGVVVEVLDLADAEATRRAVGDAALVIHCAFDPADAEWNLAAMRALAAACRATPGRRLVHLSSFVVHALPPDGTIDEASPRDAAPTGYAHTKRRLEAIVAETDGLEAVILRPTIVYGPGATTWTREPVDMLRFGRVVLPGADTGVCNALFVDDLVDAILLAATAPQAIGESFLVTGPDAVTWGKFYGGIAAEAGLKGPVYVAPAVAAREAGRAAKLLRSVRQPTAVLRRAARTSPARQLVGHALALLPGRTRRPLREWLFLPVPRWRGHVHTPNRERLALFCSRAIVDTAKARRLLGYAPRIDFATGLAETRAFIREAAAR